MAEKGISGFTLEQETILFTTERVASAFSLCGCFFVMFTFLWSSRFRKPVNRLIFYAIWGNIAMNVGTLISVNGMMAGYDAPLCQFQAFLIQMFLPADALWNLCMAINTWLTVFKKYNASQCRAMEKWYFLVNYGFTFLIALVYLFIHNYTGKMYGGAVLWCWIAKPWDGVRIATCYAPAWCAIAISFFIYTSAGRQLFRRRKQISFFHGSPASLPMELENPFTSFKTTEVQITTELASPRATDSQVELQKRVERNYLTHQSEYEEYSITIERNRNTPRRSGTVLNEDEIKMRNAAVAANKAAWGYTKCCILFFVSLLVTWIPSSVFRVYTLFHSPNDNFGIAYAAGLVLPLTGFWNAVIYTTISWDAVLDMVAGDIDSRVWRSWHGHLPRRGEWRESGEQSWPGGRTRAISLNSKEVRGSGGYVRSSSS